MASIGAGTAIALVAGLWLAQTADTPENQPTTSEPDAKQADTKLRVIASFYPLYEFSKNIGGDRAEISSLVPVGIEPHDWDPSSGDITRLKEADVFVYNGAGFEPFVEQIIESGEYGNLAFVESTKGIALAQRDSGYDPHVWLDPVLAKSQVETIKAVMIQEDPQNSQYYEANAAAYMAKLDELDAKIKSGLSNCKKDTFMPFHVAFAYFADRYGLKIFALSGIAPESEATAAEIKEFVNFVKENEIKVIFAEELVDPRLAEVLADEAGVQVMILSPIEGLTQQDIAAGKTYISKMEENLTNLKVALVCQ